MKKALALVLSLVLAFSCLPAALAATFADEASWPASASWAKDEIDYMVEKGVLNGFAEDNTFRPADSVTRAQFIKMIDETFGLTATTTINYSDVTPNLWFHPYIAKAAAQGYLLNYGTALNPNGQLTRQEAAALLARYLDLDPSEKVASSTYTDYNSIKSAYRDYVLQATYVGLFQGDEDGKFSPDRVLKRCEAAAILYRAAGTIYRASANGTDAAAGDENAVISKSGITVTGANIDGQLLITEGAAGGTITLSECVMDTLVIRGTASVLLSGCFIDEIVVDSSAASNISFLSSCDVGDIVAESAVELNISANSSVDSITVEKDAKNSSVSGSGTITKAVVNATGFKSDIVPDDYTLGTGISATLGGKVYNGVGAEIAAMGFSEEPSVYATSANAYLKVKPSVTGQLYYYFTDSAAAPTTTTFDSYYNAASVKARISVTANRSVDQNIGTTASVADYSYIVIMIKGYQPAVLANTASSGLLITPDISSDTIYDSITYITSVGGTLYYYYTNTSSAPTTASFNSTYNASTTYYKGRLTAVANQLTTLNTLASSSVSSYKYVAVQLRDAEGNEYQPVLVNRDTAFTTTGFTSAPICELDSTNVVLGLVAGANGIVEYYFTTSATVPTSDQFSANMSSADSSMTGSFSVAQNTPYYNNLPNQSAVKMYPYVVLRLTSSAGTSYYPVVVSIPAGAGISLTGTGFAQAPTTSVTSGYFYINVQTNQTGTLYYYLTNYSEAPTASTFDVNYDASVTASQLASRNGGSVAINLTSKQSLKTVITNEQGKSFNFMVLMLKVGTVNMTPIVIPLTGATDTPTVSTSTGFLVDPVHKKVTSRSNEISFTSSVNGVVYYYYTEDSTVPSDYKKVMETATTEMNNGSGFGGVYAAAAKYKSQIPVGGLFYTPPYLVVMLQDSNGLLYKPVVIPTDEAASSAVSSGFSATPTVTAPSGGVTNLTYNALYAGTLYYYFTNTSSTTPDATAFMSSYFSALSTQRGSFSVAAGSASKVLTVPTGYSYLVLMLQTTGATTANRQPIVISLYGGTTGGVTTGTTGFSGTPFVTNNVLWFNPTVSGTLYYYLTNSDTFSYSDFTGGGANQLLALTSGTKAVTATGSVQTLNLNSSGNSLMTQIISSYSNVIIWISTGTNSMTTPVVVPMNNTGSGTGTGTGTDTGSGTTATTTGFSTAPSLKTMGEFAFVDGVVAVSGTVKYFFTNSTSSYTNTNFSSGYNASVTQKGTQTYTAGERIQISVSSASYKYVWIQVDSYTPVRVQIY